MPLLEGLEEVVRNLDGGAMKDAIVDDVEDEEIVCVVCSNIVPEDRIRRVPLTVKRVMVNSLLFVSKDRQGNEKAIGKKQKLERFNLANLINQAKESIILDTDQCSLLKSLINKCYDSPLVIGRVLPVIDADDEDVGGKDAEGRGNTDSDTDPPE